MLHIHIRIVAAHSLSLSLLDISQSQRTGKAADQIVRVANPFLYTHNSTKRESNLHNTNTCSTHVNMYTNRNQYSYLLMSANSSYMRARAHTHTQFTLNHYKLRCIISHLVSPWPQRFPHGTQGPSC